jgi:hypothetical protein
MAMTSRESVTMEVEDLSKGVGSNDNRGHDCDNDESRVWDDDRRGRDSR